jgi:hypothetical protein
MPYLPDRHVEVLFHAASLSSNGLQCRSREAAPMTELLAIVSGVGVGFSLGLIGGCGSFVATLLLLYVVGLPRYVAIGTGGLAVSTNAS